MKKQKRPLHPIKQRSNWVLPAIITGITVIVALFIVGILVSMQGETIPEFDGNHVVTIAKEQFNFKNRSHGTDEYKKAKDFLLEKLKGYSQNAREQKFEYYDEEKDSTVEFTNIIVSFFPENPYRIMLSAHYDMPPDTVKTDLLAGTDNTSGIAFLLEVARILSEQQANKGVDLVFFDGSVYGNPKGTENLFLGARYFAQNNSEYKPQIAINLNSIGSPDLEMYPDEYSVQFASDMVDRIWAIAKELKIEEFKRGKNKIVADNHLVLIKNDLRCIELFDYNWSKNKTKGFAPESFEAVGTPLIQLIYQ